MAVCEKKIDGFPIGQMIVSRLKKALIIVVTAVFSACGSAAVESNNNATVVHGNVNLNSVPTANANTFSNANIANFNGNVAANDSMKRLEEIRANSNKAGKPIPSFNSRPAPEDSTITSTLTDVANETRVWKKHPVLAKVEKIYDGGDGSIKVYLKNGKVIDLPGKSITQMDQVTAAAVLSLAGVGSTAQTETKTKRAVN